MSNDTYQTNEHFLTDNPNFVALSPNGSGNGRNLDMIRRMLIDEQEAGKLFLLRSCPRRWFDEGQTITVENAPTLFGKMSIKTKAEKNRITIEIETPDRAIPDAMILYVRSPKDKPLKSAAINGKDISINGDAITLPREKGTLHIVVTR